MITGSTTATFIRFVIPSILGLLAISSAGIVDGIFVGNYIGATALAAVNLSAPMYSLFFGICAMIVLGSAVMAGKALGAGDIQRASNLFTKSVVVVGVYSVICASLTFAFAENIVVFLGAKGDVLPLTTEYIRAVSPFLVFLSTTYALSCFAKVDASPNFSLAGLITTALTNVVLDALFIKVLGWGVSGTAIATGISYMAGTAVLLLRYLGKSARIRIIKPFGSWRELIRACYNGFSEFINEISGGLVIFVINWILMTEAGATGVAAFTVANYILWFSIMIGYGIAGGLGPLVSVNFGAKKPERIARFVALGIGMSSVTGAVLAGMLLLYPQPLVSVFIHSGETKTIEMTLAIMAVIWPACLFNGINITISGYFIGIHAAGQAAMIALSRSLILPSTLVFLFWKLFGLEGAFWALPTTEILTFALSMTLLYRVKPYYDHS